MKNLMKTASLITALSLSVSILFAGFTANADSISISSARSSLGQTVTVQGIVTKSIQSSASNTNNNTVFIQDTTGGIGIYKSASFNYNSYSAGTQIQVTGKVSSYSGLLEIIPDNVSTDISVISPATLPAVSAEEITLSQLNSGNYQGKLVHVTGVTITTESTNSNHTIAQNGISSTLRAPFSGNLPDYGVGDVVDITGVAATYGSTQELMVQSESDITRNASSVPVVQFVTPVSQTANTKPQINANFSIASGHSIATGATYSLKDANNNPIAVTGSADATGATFTPVNNLATGTYTATATVAEAGNPSNTTTQTYSFTVVAAQAISAARALPIGTTVSVQGVVTRSIKSSASVANNDTVFIKDADGQSDGIGIYCSYSFTDTTYPTGTTVTVTGTLSNYNGLLEIVPSTANAVEKISEGASVTPTVITLDQLANYQGQYVEIDGVTLTAIGTNSNHTVSDGTTSVTLRCTGSNTLTGYSVGNILTVVGIAGNYNGSSQLLVQSQEDIFQIG